MKHIVFILLLMVSIRASSGNYYSNSYRSFEIDIQICRWWRLYYKIC